MKLENTLLDGSPNPLLKITDFGFCKSDKESLPKSKVGTPAYTGDSETPLSSTWIGWDSICWEWWWAVCVRVRVYIRIHLICQTYSLAWFLMFIPARHLHYVSLVFPKFAGVCVACSSILPSNTCMYRIIMHIQGIHRQCQDVVLWKVGSGYFMYKWKLASGIWRVCGTFIVLGNPSDAWVFGKSEYDTLS